VSRKRSVAADSADADTVKVPTPEMQTSPLDLLPSEPVVALQVVGEGWELPLSPVQHNFALGKLAPPAVDLSLAGKQFVSERHAFLSRRGNALTVTDNRSRNGTFFAGRRDTYGEVTAGKSFRVADVKLLALDERLRQLREHLQWVLGYDAHEQVDQALVNIADEEAKGILLLGPPGCEQRELAEAIHTSSARRHRGFVVAEPPLQHNAEEVAALTRARQGTMLVDLAAVTPLAFLARHLFGTTYHVRPIIAARTSTQVETTLGKDYARGLRVITLRPVADRRAEIPTLLDELLKRAQCARTIADLGERNLAALVTNHRWKGNFRDLREAARRCQALLEAPTQAVAAERLGMSPSSLSEWLSGLGMKFHSGK
jgi:hypothetical protein